MNGDKRRDGLIDQPTQAWVMRKDKSARIAGLEWLPVGFGSDSCSVS